MHTNWSVKKKDESKIFASSFSIVDKFFLGFIIILLVFGFLIKHKEKIFDYGSEGGIVDGIEANVMKEENLNDFNSDDTSFQDEKVNQVEEVWINLSEKQVILSTFQVFSFVEVESNALNIENDLMVDCDDTNIVNIEKDGNLIYLYPVNEGVTTVNVEVNGVRDFVEVVVIGFEWGNSIEMSLDETVSITTYPLEISNTLIGPMELQVCLEVSDWKEYEPFYFQVWYIDENGYYSWLGNIDLSVQQNTSWYPINIPDGVEVNELIFTPYCVFDEYSLNVEVYFGN